MSDHDQHPDPESGEPGGGAGRKEDVKGSGVYPASGAEIPKNAKVRTAGEWGKGAGGEDNAQSELIFTEEELRRARAGEPIVPEEETPSSKSKKNDQGK
jgi:hypothetical protein